MVKFNKEMKEKRRLLILQKLSEKKTIADISKELNCGASTVFRIKKSYANYLIKLDYNKPKNNERLKRKYDSWKRKEKEANINESELTMKEKNQIVSLYIPKRIEEKEDNETEDESEKPEEHIEAFLRKYMEMKKKQ